MSHGGGEQGTLIPERPELEGLGHGEAVRASPDSGGLIKPGWGAEDRFGQGCHELMGAFVELYLAANSFLGEGTCSETGHLQK